MVTNLVKALMLLGVLILFADRSAHAQESPEVADPTQLAARCVHSVTEWADACTKQNAQSARRCVRRIGALLAQGQVREARQVAHRCIHSVNRQSDACVDRIRRRCRRCVERLLELGAEQLAERVRESCEQSRNAVRHSQRHAIAAIRQALDNQPSESAQ